MRPGRRYHAVSPALRCHLAFIGWMNLQCVFPAWVSVTSVSNRTFTSNPGIRSGCSQSSAGLVHTFLNLRSLPNLHPGTPRAGLFVPWFPGSAAGAVGWGGGGGRSRKSVGGSCLLVPKASKAVTAPSSQHDASPNSHTGVSANKAHFFFTICS